MKVLFFLCCSEIIISFTPQRCKVTDCHDETYSFFKWFWQNLLVQLIPTRALGIYIPLRVMLKIHVKYKICVGNSQGEWERERRSFFDHEAVAGAPFLLSGAVLSVKRDFFVHSKNFFHRLVQGQFKKNCFSKLNSIYYIEVKCDLT